MVLGGDSLQNIFQGHEFCTEVHRIQYFYWQSEFHICHCNKIVIEMGPWVSCPYVKHFEFEYHTDPNLQHIHFLLSLWHWHLHGWHCVSFQQICAVGNPRYRDSSQDSKGVEREAVMFVSFSRWSAPGHYCRLPDTSQLSSYWVNLCLFPPFLGLE